LVHKGSIRRLAKQLGLGYGGKVALEGGLGGVYHHKPLTAKHFEH
jgi:hypothetical protein